MPEKLRKVEVYRMAEKVVMGGDKRFLSGVAFFHAWGIDFQELADGPFAFTVAIVEWGDGCVECVHPSMIKFADQG